MAEVYNEPSTVAMTNGVVTVDGPGNTAVTLTPEAAAETADRLLECADKAFVERGQHVLDEPSPRRERHNARAIDQREGLRRQ